MLTREAITACVVGHHRADLMPVLRRASFSDTEVQSDWVNLGATVVGPSRLAPTNTWSDTAVATIRAGTWRCATGT